MYIEHLLRSMLRDKLHEQILLCDGGFRHKATSLAFERFFGAIRKLPDDDSSEGFEKNIANGVANVIPQLSYALSQMTSRQRCILV